MPKTLKIMLLMLTVTMSQVAPASTTLPSVRLEIISRESAYDGEVFGEYGPYERIVASAHMRIDPNASANRRIVDLELAPRDADGMVDYTIDLIILRPRNGARARRVLLYEVVNRGMQLMSMMSGGNFDPNNPGDGLLQRQGFTLVASGWQGDISAKELVGARFPTVMRKDEPVTGPVSTEKIFDNPEGNKIALSYPAATLDQSQARLTVRALADDAPVPIVAANWRFIDAQLIAVERPENMDAGAIYSFKYTARDPKVMGLGFAATRDIVTWLRHASAEQGNPLANISAASCERSANDKCVNPDSGIFSTVVAFGGSQSGRYLRDFLWQDFNRSLAGGKVFDGVIPFVPGARQTFTNFRFAEPGRFSRQHEDHDVPGFTFPFTYATLADPVTGKRDGILRACKASGTCPKVFHIDTGAEFWQAGASLVGTGGTDHDVTFPANVRAYMIASGAHAPGMTGPMCELPANPLNYSPVVRALLLGMVDWTSARSEPPASRWPRLADGDLQPVKSLAVPAASSLGLVWPKVLNRPIAPEGKPAWSIFVPSVDADGNEAPGIRMPQIVAPTGTYLPWNPRKPGYAKGDLCLVFGAYLPFAKDAASRGDDPRLSLAERYQNRDTRAELFKQAIKQLRRDGFLLDEDAKKLVKEAAPDG